MEEEQHFLIGKAVFLHLTKKGVIAGFLKSTGFLEWLTFWLVRVQFGFCC
jgi:hypothetical protein